MSSVAVPTLRATLTRALPPAVHAREMSKKGRVRILKGHIHSNRENGRADHDTIKHPRRDRTLCSCSNFTAQLIVNLAP